MREVISNKQFQKESKLTGRITLTSVGDVITVVGNVINSNSICTGYKVMNLRTNEVFDLTVSEYGSLTFK